VKFHPVYVGGVVVPDLWMENATGAPVGAGPLLRATQNALGK
jgi:hypothetical protein